MIVKKIIDHVENKRLSNIFMCSKIVIIFRDIQYFNYQ